MATTTAEDKVARLWDLETGKEQQSWKPANEQSIAAMFWSDGKHLLLWYGRLPYHVWDIQAGTEVKKFEGAAKFGVSGLLPGGKQFINSDNRFVYTRDVATGEVVASQDFGPDTLAGGWSWSYDARRFIIAFKEIVRVYRLADGKELARFIAPVEHWGAVGRLSMSADGRYAAAGTKEGELIVWYIPPDQP
jgi:WD40 repeat protein